MIRRWLGAVMALTLWPCAGLAASVSCVAQMTDLAFGSINPLSSQTDSSATLTYTCSNTFGNTRHALLCLSMDAGAQGGGNTTPRQMQDGAGGVVGFQAYQDAARSLVWGNQFGAPAGPVTLSFDVPGKGTYSGSVALYGRVLNGQTSAIPGTYQNMFTGAHTSYTVASSPSGSPAACNGAIAGTFPFTVSGTVTKQCLVTAQTLDFGSKGVLSGSTNATGQVDVTCSSGTPYAIGMDAGLNGGGNINARKATLGSNSIGYQIYLDSGHTMVWGTGSGTTAGSTGTGSDQAFPVYGQIPAQSTPGPGTYTDTVIVTVTY